jgi:hypothetical protein
VLISAGLKAPAKRRRNHRLSSEFKPSGYKSGPSQRDVPKLWAYSGDPINMPMTGRLECFLKLAAYDRDLRAERLGLRRITVTLLVRRAGAGKRYLPREIAFPGV